MHSTTMTLLASNPNKSVSGGVYKEANDMFT